MFTEELKTFFIKFFIFFAAAPLFARETDTAFSSRGAGIVFLRSVSGNIPADSPWRIDSVTAENVPGIRVAPDLILLHSAASKNRPEFFHQDYTISSPLTRQPVAYDMLTGLVLLKTDSEGILFANSERVIPVLRTEHIPVTGERMKVVSQGETASVPVTESTVYFEQFASMGGDYAPPLPVMILSGKGQGIRSGSPVFMGPYLTGIIISHNSEKGISYALPHILINQFLRYYRNTSGIKLTADKDTDSSVSLVPEPGFRTAAVRSEAVRTESGLRPGRGGAFISGVSRDSGAFPLLQKGDILTAADGKNISAAGLAEHPVYGSLPPEVFIILDSKGELRPAGSVVNLTVVRNKEMRTLKMKLDSYRPGAYRIPYTVPGSPYLISGGLVFQELSGKYIEEYEKAGEKIPVRLKYLMQFSRFSPDALPDRYVVLDRILPLSVNRGYEGRHLLLLGINGIAVRSLQHAADLIDESLKSRKNTEFLFESGLMMILNNTGIRDSEQETILKYGIPYLRR